MFKIRARAIFLNRESKFESELEPLAAWTGLSAFTICSLISNLTRAIERRTYRSFSTYINCAGSRQSSKFGRRVRSSEFRELAILIADLSPFREVLSELRLTQSGLSDLNWPLLLCNRSVKSLDRSLDVMDLLQSLKFIVGMLRHLSSKCCFPAMQRKKGE